MIEALPYFFLIFFEYLCEKNSCIVFIPSRFAIFEIFVGSIPKTLKPIFLKPFSMDPSFEPISITSLFDLFFKFLVTFFEIFSKLFFKSFVIPLR